MRLFQDDEKNSKIFESNLIRFTNLNSSRSSDVEIIIHKWGRGDDVKSYRLFTLKMNTMMMKMAPQFENEDEHDDEDGSPQELWGVEGSRNYWANSIGNAHSHGIVFGQG